MRFRAFEAAAALGATVVGPDVEIDGVSFDSRAVAAGQLFAPIVAERDGHTFLPDALARGAVAYLTAQRPIGGTAIVVDDTLDALMRLAAWGRERWGAGDPMRRVVGITGSVGKTSTKDLAAAAITASARTWANERSFNNDQGLPTTILNAPDTTDVMILEMGMRGFGEISRLCSIGRPDLGIVTRVANAHTERVGDLAGVARAKGELIEALPLGGVAILNGDDERVRAMARRAPGRAVLYGTMPDCEVHIGEVVLDPMARPAFRLETPWGSFDVRLAASGAHMAANAAAALSCVGVLGLDVAAGVDALRTASITPMRMEVRRLASGRGPRRRQLQREPGVDARCARRARGGAGDATGRSAGCHGRARRPVGRACAGGGVRPRPRRRAHRCGNRALRPSAGRGSAGRPRVTLRRRRCSRQGESRGWAGAPRRRARHP
jgi:UDP-N-acetylmuramoyl-tripeptide--D-alanyl-D-alanine ligase